MITLRRTDQRRFERRGKREVWRTFAAENAADPLAGGFGALECLNELQLQPGVDMPRGPQVAREGEIVTYVREGALAYEDALGRLGVIQAGEFQRLSAGRGLRHHETNASRSDSAQVLQLWLRPGGAARAGGHEHKRFSAAERRGDLCVVASPDGRRGSLRLSQNVVVWSALLDPGQHVAHELAQGRGAWLHLVAGEVALGETVLTTGDGAGVTGERAVSLTAREASEILLVDLDEPQSVPVDRKLLGRG